MHSVELMHDSMYLALATLIPFSSKDGQRCFFSRSWSHTVVSYQNESFSSKWELPFLPPSSLELWRKERARRPLILIGTTVADRVWLSSKIGELCVQCTLLEFSQVCCILLFQCDRGYLLVGGPTGATCIDGHWSPTQLPRLERNYYQETNCVPRGIICFYVFHLS